MSRYILILAGSIILGLVIVKSTFIEWGGRPLPGAEWAFWITASGGIFMLALGASDILK